MAAPGSVATRPHFSFKSSAGEPVKLDFKPGLSRMAVLIRARHELDGPKPKSMEFNILTRIIQRSQFAFTSKWKNYVPNKEDEYTYNPEMRDENLLWNLDRITAVCRVLRGLEIPPIPELHAMMVVIVAALKDFSEDEARWTQWLEMDSGLEIIAKKMMGDESGKEEEEKEEEEEEEEED
ncbi:MAG: hypothetical protein Q9226_005833 [Calogaya cf. arnoldii]